MKEIINIKESIFMTNGWTDTICDVELSDGKTIKLPVCHNATTHLPLPSECDEWIEAYRNIKKNFTDEQIIALNKRIMEDTVNG